MTLSSRSNEMPASSRQIRGGNDQRRVRDDAGLAVDDAGQLRERLEAVFRARLARPPLRHLRPAELTAARAAGARSSRRRDGRTRRRGCPSSAKLSHRLAVGADSCDHGLRAFRLGEVPVAARDLEARSEPLHVPLERSGQRLVEVVEVEDERRARARRSRRSSRGGRRRRAAPGARPRGRGEVMRHDGCRAAVEGERRDQHAPVADGDEFRDAGGRLGLEDRDGIAVFSDFEIGVARPRALGTGRAALRGAVRSREVRHRQSGCGRDVLLLVDSDHEISFRSTSSGASASACPSFYPELGSCEEGCSTPIGVRSPRR